MDTVFAKTSTSQHLRKSYTRAPKGQKMTAVANEEPARSSLDCCDLSQPTHALMWGSAFLKKQLIESMEKGKWRRYFQNDWLEKYSWLVLCKTSAKAFCQTCRYVLHSNMQTPSSNGIEIFTTDADGVNNWKEGARILAEHNNFAFHRDCEMKLNSEAPSAQHS